LEVAGLVQVVACLPKHVNLAPEVLNPLAVAVLGDDGTGMGTLCRDGRNRSREFEFIVIYSGVVRAYDEPKVFVVADKEMLVYRCIRGRSAGRKNDLQ
jgi:hypothetical protein